MTTLLLLAVALRSMRAILRDIAFWQIKEYRLDRTRAHFSLPNARTAAFHPVSVMKWVALFWALMNNDLAQTVVPTAALFAVYAGESAWLFAEVVGRRLRRPKLTLRSTALCAASATAATALFAVARDQGSPLTTTALAIDRSLSALVALGVLATAPLAATQRALLTRRAERALRAHGHIIVVGITGSYGKSSAKEFLAAILEWRFRVLKTPANVNTEAGVARLILSRLRPEHEIFLCEMGAYRRGEIARLAAMTHPVVGVLTAIGEQHLALFGSPANIATAKGELLRALPAEGTVVVNGDDRACVEQSRTTPAKRVLRYGFSAGVDIRAINVRTEREQLQFTVEIGSERTRLVLPLLGEMHVRNVLAACASAHALGMTLPEIADAATGIRPLPRTMEPKAGPKGAFVVDDSYSANPTGVMAALHYLRASGGAPTVVVMASMIELGPEAIVAHERVGRALAEVMPSLIVLTSKDFAETIISSAVLANPEMSGRFIVTRSVSRALRALQPHLSPSAVVLLEGRIPGRLRAALLAA